MKLPFFSTTSSSSSNSPSTSKNKKNSKKKSSPPRSNRNSPSGSFSSSSDSSPETPTSVIRRPPHLGRNASCLDPEYYPIPSPPLLCLDSDGKMDRTKLETALELLGSSKGGVADLLAEVDPDSQGRVDLVDLIGDEEGEEEELKVAFSVYDANGDGKISAEELHKVFRTLGDGSCSLDKCRKMIERVDSDGDGLVCFGDFAKMLSIKSR